LLASLPFVRRPSGGSTLVHHHEVTYALAVPPKSPWPARMHGIIAEALEGLGVTARPVLTCGDQPCEGPLCFRHFTGGERVVGGAKVVGSARWKQRGSLLQHGAILLAQSLHTPSLPGIRELTGRALDAEELCEAVRKAFAGQTGCEPMSADWTEGERRRIDEL